ncbi:cardiolipin synthase A [Devosia pacifica]|uniref:Cardiolipin synthase n=1 Tax=Devosia pacifica TaxID=1335967 RepID=A0A918RT87_9HYPH|nr:cardiolipin synthase [Devosia pacifica]GHA10364.1 cardiolipin synthase A [Devosia pacifica]
MLGIDDILQAMQADMELIAVVLAANYLLAVVCAVREVMNSRTSQGSIAWLLSLLLLPFPTAFLYLVFGWKFFDDYAIDRIKLGRTLRPVRARDLALIDREASHQWPVLTGVAELPFLAGNKVELLIDGAETFGSIFDGISKAERYLLVQFYILRDDRLGRELADKLIERARAGVSVYVLYDEVGSSSLPAAYRQRLRAAGIEIAAFNQRHKFLQFYGPARLNYRNHRKIVVADGETAWVGGHNVGVEYLGEDTHFGAWRDTHVRVRGPAALACALVFREDWEWATGEMLPGDPPDLVATPGDQSVLVMGTGPADRLEECAIAFTDVIAQARERLWIVSPYFVPDTDVRTALFAAQMRGVDVRIMLPEKPDHWLVWLASIAHADGMVDHGVSMYRYTDGFLHQKVLLMDDRIASIGSVNFDNRSFAINFEITLWFQHRDTIASVETMLLKDFEVCRKVSRAEVAGRPLLWRFITQAARLFSPIL